MDDLKIGAHRASFQPQQGHELYITRDVTSDISGKAIQKTSQQLAETDDTPDYGIRVFNKHELGVVDIRAKGQQETTEGRTNQLWKKAIRHQPQLTLMGKNPPSIKK